MAIGVERTGQSPARPLKPLGLGCYHFTGAPRTATAAPIIARPAAEYTIRVTRLGFADFGSYDFTV